MFSDSLLYMYRPMLVQMFQRKAGILINLLQNCNSKWNVVCQFLLFFKCSMEQLYEQYGFSFTCLCSKAVAMTISTCILPPLYSIIRYCYLLSDLTPELLRSKCSTYEDLRDYLRYRGREAYFQKTVSYYIGYHLLGIVKWNHRLVSSWIIDYFYHIFSISTLCYVSDHHGLISGDSGERSSRTDEGSREVPSSKQHRSVMEGTLASPQVRTASCGVAWICPARSPDWVQAWRL